jgi:hypothetical protein
VNPGNTYWSDPGEPRKGQRADEEPEGQREGWRGGRGRAVREEPPPHKRQAKGKRQAKDKVLFCINGPERGSVSNGWIITVLLWGM